MPRTEHGWTISTLQDHLESGSTLTLYCSCGHSLQVGLPRLIEIFGGDFELVANRDYFLSRFRCNQCGERPYGQTIGTSHNPHF